MENDEKNDDDDDDDDDPNLQNGDGEIGKGNGRIYIV